MFPGERTLELILARQKPPSDWDIILRPAFELLRVYRSREEFQDPCKKPQAIGSYICNRDKDASPEMSKSAGFNQAGEMIHLSRVEGAADAGPMLNLDRETRRVQSALAD
jgi:hypothetical protein